MWKRSIATLALAVGLGIPAVSAVCAATPQQENTQHGAMAQTKDDTATPKSDLYTLDSCPVSGGKLGAMGDPVVKQIDGREVRFCCPACVEPFEKDKTKFFAEIDRQLIKQQMPYYPLDTCVVTGDPLTEDGEDIAVNYVYNNRLVHFCCKMCVKDFNKDPQKFLDKLDAAVIEKQREHYPLDICVISGEKLGKMGEPVERIYGNRLVRFCCPMCIKTFEKNPVGPIEKLNAAWLAMHEKHGEAHHEMNEAHHEMNEAHHDDHDDHGH